MSEKGYIQYIILIIIVLAIAFLSQQPYFREYGKSLFSKGIEAVQGYMAKGANWVNSNVYPKIGGEVSQKTAIITNEINQQKQNTAQNISDKIKNSFSGAVDSVLHTSSTQASSQNCQSVPAPAK